jgi:RNA polymerase sigma-70 factor, ECF subfamily
VSVDSVLAPGAMQAPIEGLSDRVSPPATTDITQASDRTLMLGLRARRPEALAEVFRRHSAGVARAAQHFLRGSLGSDDVVQDVFEKLFQSPERYDAERGSLAAYLGMQARARSIDVIRSQSSRARREVGSELPDSRRTAEDEALPQLSGSAIRTALDDLPRHERVPIELAYFGGLTYREVARHLGIPEGTAKARIRTGMQHLRVSPGVMRLLADANTDQDASPVSSPAACRHTPIRSIQTLR